MKNTFRNPILPGFYPDPSICRVGKDYYLANSSFAYFPGVPLFHSRDLVNWRQIGHALTRKSQLALDHVDSTFGFLDSCKNSLGIWAPTLRHHDDTFYLVTTNMSHGGHFVVKAKDPAGEWSDPVWLDQPGIDPSPFWDADGRGYLLSNLWPSGPHGIVMAEMDFATGKRRTDVLMIWEGSGAQTPEGPHLYQRDGCYYLLTAEGGTGSGHLVSIARSRSLWGPYESCPRNPILSHRSLNSPIQNTGHGDLVEAPDGSWWMVFLGTRPLGFPPCHHLGRETFLAPVTWEEEGWPCVNGGQPVQLVMQGPAFLGMPAQVGFGDMAWNFLRNPDPQCYERSSDVLIMHGSEVPLDDGSRSPSWMGQRQRSFESSVSVTMEFSPCLSREAAGLCVYMSEQFHCALEVSMQNNARIVRLRRRLGPLSDVSDAVLLPAEGPVRLSIKADRKNFTFHAGVEIGEFPCRLLSSECAGGFTGIYFALFAEGINATVRFSDWSHQFPS